MSEVMEERPDQALTLRQIFGEKLLDWSSADRMIKFITGLGIAQIVVAVLLIGLNFLDLPAITVNRPDGTVSYKLSVLLLAVCMLFMATAWTLLMAGALHSRLLVRIPVVLLFFLLHGWLLIAHASTIVGWMMMPMALGYIIWHGVAKPHGYVRDLLVFGLGVSFLYVALVDQSILFDHSGQFTTLVLSMQIMILSFFLMPLLMFAGLDLGESVRDVTRWMIGQGAARTEGRVLFWIAVGLCLVKVVWMAVTGDLNWSWLTAGIFLALSGYVTVRMRPWQGMHQEPQFGLVLTGAIVSMSALAGLAVYGVLAGGNMASDNYVWLTVGMVTLAAVVAILVIRRRTDAGARTVMTFLALFALWNLARLVGAPPVWKAIFGNSKGFVDLYSADGAAAVLLPALLFYLRRRNLVTRSISTWAISLTAGFSVIRAMHWLVDNNFDIPATAAAAQLLVMAIGLTWDVLTSGDKWTNGDSARMPRKARVLLYFGYVSVAVTTILFFKGTGQSGTFDEDMLAIMGLYILGVPVYLYGFARVGVLLVHQTGERAAE